MQLKIHKLFALVLVLITAPLAVQVAAKETVHSGSGKILIELLPGEYWWGGVEC